MGNDYTLSAKITGDSSEFQHAVSVAEKTLASFDKQTENIGTKISNVGKALSKYITTPAIGATTALAGITLTKGWNRMTALDDAKTKLQAIGNSAVDVTEIMNNALASVKGTAYGMDEAATTAASAVAAGIKPGQKLEKYLTAVADASAVANIEMADMGAIFNKVATQGKASNEILQQMAERGIPIYQYLADEINCTAGKVFDLAKDGSISLETFQKAVENHIGGAAKSIGSSTITGAISNIGASISRIGENLLGSADDATTFAGQVLPLLNDFTGYLGDIEEKAKIIGSVVGEVFGATVDYVRDGELEISELSNTAAKVIEKFTPIIDKVKSISDAFEGLSTNAKIGFAGSTIAAGPLLTIFGKTMQVTGSLNGKVSSVCSDIKTSILKIPGSFSSITAGIKGVIGDFKNLGSGLLQPISPVLQKLQSKVSGSFLGLSSKITVPFKNISSVISDSIGNLIGNIGMKFPKLAGAIGVFESNSKGMFANIGGSISSLLKTAGSFAPTFLKSMGIAGGVGLLIAGMGLLQTQFGGQLYEMLLMVQEKGPEIITNLCNGIVSKLPFLIQSGGTLILNLLSAITANLPAIINGGISIISALVSGLAQQLPRLIPAAVKMIITIVTALTAVENISSLINAGIALLSGLVDGIIASLPILIAAAPELIKNLVTAIAENLPKILQAGIDLLIELATGIINAIPDLLLMLPEIFDSIKEAFKSVDWSETGKDLMESIIDGIKNMANSIWNAVTDIVDGIKSRFSFSASLSADTSSSSTPQLAHGTDYWQGGFAYMNEGGRGELTYLPSGAQVIPHDISVKYAQEAARLNTNANSLDLQELGDYIIIGMSNQTQTMAKAIEKGIGNMRLVAGNREAGRFISNLGFVKA